MASVLLVKGAESLRVSTAFDYVAAVYGRGFLPAVGSIRDNLETLQTSVPAPALPGAGNSGVTVAQFNAHLAAAEPHKAYDVDIPSLRILFENGLA